MLQRREECAGCRHNPVDGLLVLDAAKQRRTYHHAVRSTAHRLHLVPLRYAESDNEGLLGIFLHAGKKRIKRVSIAMA